MDILKNSSHPPNASRDKIPTELADLNMDKAFPPTPRDEQIFEEVVNFFQTDDWPFVQIAEQAIQTSFQGDNGKWNCYANIRIEQQQFIFYSVCPVNTPEDKRLSMAEFIARANYGMAIGNFELDFADGEIRYKTSIDVEGDELSFALIKQLVYANVTMMDEYLPGMMSVIYGDVSPAEAINQIELISDIPQSSDEEEQFADVVPASNQEELKVSSSWQTDVQKQETKLDSKSHILSILTPEEIAQFHQLSQMVEPYQQKKVQELTEKLKSVIITRLGELGEEIFTRASTFFIEVKLEAKNLKLIQRYSGLGGRTRLLLQRLNYWSEQYGELPANSQGRITLVELEKLFWRIDERLQELPTDKFEGGKEVKLLIEIEELREKLGVYENLIRKIDENSDIGLASTQ